MEVTHIKDHVTHAVLGGGAAEACGISDSAEFFHVLSSTLYSRKKEAVVREVLCNAWDAHVDGGIASIPVEVTLTPEKLIIRDFGEGIPRDKIREIYGVYGASTKKKNKLVTGGFGLGSKAPWAYVDHFQVTSWCQGEQTIYSMSKSSAQVLGKPMITPMVTIDTDDSGLEVSINLKNTLDQHEFQNLVTRIAAMGEMNIRLNGEVLPSVPFSEAKNGYILFKRKLVGDQHGSIFVRYGHVVYPVEVNDAYSKLHNRISKFLQSINAGFGPSSDDWVLAVQADPDTISVTPSRESLSMTEHTITTLTQLLARALSNINGKLEKTCVELNQQAINTLWLVGTPASLMVRHYGHKLANEKGLPKAKQGAFITEVTELGGAFMRKAYPSFSNFRAADMRQRIDALVDSNFGLKGMYKLLRREMQIKGGLQAKTDFLHRRLLWPTMKRLNRNGLDAKRLLVFADDVMNPRTHSREPGFVEPIEFKKLSLENQLPFLRGIVIVAYNRAAVLERVYDFPATKHWFGNPINSLTYIVPRVGDHGKRAIEHFEKQGFYVFDLTRYHKWETAPEPKAKKPAKAKTKKKKLTGFPTLTNLIDKTVATGLSTVKIYKEEFAEEAIRIDEPEFAIVLGDRGESFSSPSDTINPDAFRAICRLYGDKGAVVRSSTILEKLTNAGVKSMNDWLKPVIANEMLTNPLIETHFRNSMSIWVSSTLPSNWDHITRQIVKVVLSDEELRKALKLPPRVPDREADIIRIFKDFARFEQRKPPLDAVEKKLRTWTASPELQALYDMAQKNARLLDIFDPGNISTLLLIKVATDAQKNMVRNFLLTTLKGK